MDGTPDREDAQQPHYLRRAGRGAGVGKAYVCQILNGVKKPKDIQKRMENALDAIIERRKK